MICYLLLTFNIYLFFRKYYFWSILIFFFLLLDGFQLVPPKILTAGFYSGSSIDAALLSFLGIFFFRAKYWLSNAIMISSLSKVIWFFIFVLSLNMTYGMLKGYAFGDVFKGARLYLFLLSFLMFAEIPGKEINRIIKVLIIITLFQSLLFLLQIVIGQTILQGPKELVMTDLKYTRYYNTPKLLDFALAICLFWFPFEYSKNIRLILIGVFILTVLGPLHRGYMFSWLLTLGLYSLLFNSYKKKIFYILAIVSVIIVAFSVEIFRIRIMEAADQLLVVNDIISNRPVYVNSTFVFRVNHLIERLTYINKDPLGWFFGIGLLDDKAPQAADLPFRYGLPDPITGHIVKIYTPDLVWSLIFLTMGYVGGFFYTYIFINILVKYAKNGSGEIYKVIFTLTLIGLLGSFTANTLLLPSFFVPIIFLVVIMEKNKILSKNASIHQIQKRLHHHLI